MKILIIEDETKLGKYLQLGLNESSFTTDWVNNGVDGLHQAMSPEYDLILLDVMLPDLDGWEILTKIKTYYPTRPIIMLTARDSVEDRVKGLQLGADDYLVKPFAFIELIARIQNQVRKNENVATKTTLTIADLHIDLIRRRVTRNDQHIDLTAKEFLLLELLVSREKEVLSKAFIASKVWDMNFDSDTNVIEVAIRRLRKKVDDPFEFKLIHTLRGMGYVMESRE